MDGGFPPPIPISRTKLLAPPTVPPPPPSASSSSSPSSSFPSSTSSSPPPPPPLSEALHPPPPPSPKEADGTAAPPAAPLRPPLRPEEGDEAAAPVPSAEALLSFDAEWREGMREAPVQSLHVHAKAWRSGRERLVELANGRKLRFKTSGGTHNSRWTTWSDQGWAEVAAYHIDRLLRLNHAPKCTSKRIYFDDDVPVYIKGALSGLAQEQVDPNIVETDPDGRKYFQVALQEEVPNFELPAKVDPAIGKALENPVSLPDGVPLQDILDVSDIVTFDYIIHNFDRYSGKNWGRSNGRFISFDNGLGWWKMPLDDCKAWLDCPPKFHFKGTEHDVNRHACNTLDYCPPAARKLCLFRREFVALLRAVADPSAGALFLPRLLAASLAEEALQPAFPPRYGPVEDYYTGIMNRINYTLSVVDECIGLHGEEAVLRSTLPKPTKGVEVALTAPRALPEGMAIPVVVKRTTPFRALDVTVVSVTCATEDGTTVSSQGVTLYDGVGSTLLRPPAAAGRFVVSVDVGPAHARVPVEVTRADPSTYARAAAVGPGERVVWTAAAAGVVAVTGSLEVAAGGELVVEEGVVVLLARHASITVHGRLTVLGTPRRPVVFAPAAAAPDGAWGQVSVPSGAASAALSHALFVGGGGDRSKKFGHSDSQPVLRADNGGRIEFRSGAVMDSPGKAIGGVKGEWEFEDVVVTRCDTGGQLDQALASFSRCAFLEMPDADGKLEDDDNDGLYLHTPHPSGVPTRISDCVFAVGEDDGLDQNGANVDVERTWFHGFAHEGIATSSEKQDAAIVHVSDTVVTECEQGIEVGYGKPKVTVTHCLLTRNDVGLRYGDDYTWAGHDGVLDGSHVLSFGNRKEDYLNRFNTQGVKSRPSAVSLACFAPGDAKDAQLVDGSHGLFRVGATCAASAGRPEEVYGPLTLAARPEGKKREDGGVPAGGGARRRAVACLRGAAVAEASGVKKATLYTKEGCGLSFQAVTTATDCSKAFFKSIRADPSHYEGEWHLRELAFFALDQVLAGGMVSPVVGRVFKHGDVPGIQAAQFREAASCQGTADGCGAAGCSGEVAGVLVGWTEGAAPKTLPPSLASADGMVQYVVTNYLAGCLRSDHNHFFSPTGWLAIDNDRCFMPESAITPDMPALHKGRWAKMADLLWDARACAVLQSASVRGFLQHVASLAGKNVLLSEMDAVLAGDALRVQVMDGVGAVVAEVEKRLEKLAGRLQSCGVELG